jgi:ABC-2 type transport system ATP-binding protein
MSVLVAEGLSKSYGSLAAVRDLSLRVDEGEVFGILGPNGAGKTTAMNMMCGLLRPDAGRVLVRGRPVTGEARTRVGVCPQHIVIWKELECLEQLAFLARMYGVAGSEARRRGACLLDELGLGSRARARAKTLSGGMQRRLNIALALVHDPEIVLLDEPEAGLDPQSRVLVRDYIRTLARSRTVIVTTHNMDEAERVASRVAIIDHGELLEVDTPENLKKSAGPGDVLEIAIEGDPQDSCGAVESLVDVASIVGGTLMLRAQDMAERLPRIMARLEEAGARVVEVRLRQSTLEDVFISLTGRGLRE